MERISGVLLAAALLTGCAGKKPAKVDNFRWNHCLVVHTEIDPQGNERKDCLCNEGKEIGLEVDLSTGKVYRVIRCK